MNISTRFKLSTALLICFLPLWALPVSSVWAHKVNLFAYAEKGTVYTQSYFPDGRVVEKGKVEVFDSGGQRLLEGVTDEKGLFSFPIDKADDLTIVLNATMGHKNSYILKKEELGVPVPKEERAEKGEGKGQTDPNPQSNTPAGNGIPPTDYQQLVQLIEKENRQLSDELRQLRHEIAVLRQEIAKPGMSQIFAGIGYILGFAGIGLYVHTRKARPKVK